jgi:7-keto-8-aminopelargonate synthetase-like enzyme
MDFSNCSAEDTILFGSCFDATADFFDAILDNKDVVIRYTLNPASIINR